MVGSEQLFFYVARHYYLTGRPNLLFFDHGVGGVPGGGPGGAGGARGGPLAQGASQGPPGVPRGGSPGGSSGGQKVIQKTMSKKSTSLVKISSRRDFMSMNFDEILDRFFDVFVV
jgi:hypothetical protein